MSGHIQRWVLLLAVLLGLAACGFQPMYGVRGQGPGMAALLAGIAVATPDRRLEQLVYRHLVERMGQAGKASHQLEFQVRERAVGLAVRRDDSINRRNLTLTADFQLFKTGVREPVFRSTSQAIAAMNVVQSDYANLIAERDARARAARALAEDITNRLAVYFGRDGQ